MGVKDKCFIPKKERNGFVLNVALKLLNCLLILDGMKTAMSAAIYIVVNATEKDNPNFEIDVVEDDSKKIPSIDKTPLKAGFYRL